MVDALLHNREIAERSDILKEIIKMLNEFKPDNEQRAVFGRGDASERIIRIVG